MASEHWSYRKNARREAQIAALGELIGAEGEFASVMDHALASTLAHYDKEVNVYDYQVLELNGGQLCLYLFDDDGRVIRGVSNLEYLSHEDYRASVMAVHNGEDDMSDWDSQIEVPQADYDAATAYRDLGACIIADRYGIYPESMGAAGQLAYGIDADECAAPLGDEEYADLAREWGIV